MSYIPPEQNPFQPLRIADMGTDDKPRERALRLGIGSLSDAELLAVVLGGGMPGMNVVEMAQRMLMRVDGSLPAMARIPITGMVKEFKGVGPAKAVSLAAAFELGKRLEAAREAEAANKERQIRSSADIYRVMRHRLQLLEHEEMWVLMLSRSNRIIATQCISRGGVSATVVDPRIVFREAINCMASGLVLVHNHPSGNLRPSGNDDNITRQIRDAAKLLDMRLLDHLVISGDGYFSYSDEGRL